MNYFEILKPNIFIINTLKHICISSLFCQDDEILGVFMRNWDERDEFGHCQTDEDYEYASKVCERLKIPLTEVCM